MFTSLSGWSRRYCPYGVLRPRLISCKYSVYKNKSIRIITGVRRRIACSTTSVDYATISYTFRKSGDMELTSEHHSHHGMIKTSSGTSKSRLEKKREIRLPWPSKEARRGLNPGLDKASARWYYPWWQTPNYVECRQGKSGTPPPPRGLPGILSLQPPTTVDHQWAYCSILSTK